MSREAIITDQHKMYVITKDSAGNFYMEVVVGGFAMETLVIRLSQEELDDYKKEGKLAMDDLAYRICKDSESFKSRTE